MKIITAGILLFNDDKMLILKSHKGYWDLPKGKLDAGETAKQAALRETFEETGIKDIELGKGEEFIIKDKGMKFFIGKTNSAAVTLLRNKETNKLEHTEYLWLTPKEAKKLLRKRLKKVLTLLDK